MPCSVCLVLHAWPPQRRAGARCCRSAEEQGTWLVLPATMLPGLPACTGIKCLGRNVVDAPMPPRHRPAGRQRLWAEAAAAGVQRAARGGQRGPLHSVRGEHGPHGMHCCVSPLHPASCGLTSKQRRACAGPPRCPPFRSAFTRCSATAWTTCLSTIPRTYNGRVGPAGHKPRRLARSRPEQAELLLRSTALVTT